MPTLPTVPRVSTMPRATCISTGDRSLPIPYFSGLLTVNANALLDAHKGPRCDAHGRCYLIAPFGWTWSHTQMGLELLLGFLHLGVLTCRALRPSGEFVGGDGTPPTPIQCAIPERKDER
jgi:hypothetical protein